MTIFYLPSWHRPFFSYLKPVSRCFRTSPLTHRSDRQISLPREYLYPYVTMWTVFQQAHCFREFFMFKKFTSWPNFSTHMFATQEKSEMRHVIQQAFVVFAFDGSVAVEILKFASRQYNKQYEYICILHSCPTFQLWLSNNKACIRFRLVTKSEFYSVPF